MTAIAFPENAGFQSNIRPAWCGDVLTRDHVLPGGIKLDPAQFPGLDGVRATVGLAGAAIGATSIPVDALEGPIPAETILNFGTLAPVVVTVAPAGALAGATTVPVDALSGPIPNGTTIHLGTNKYVTLNAAAAAGATSLTTLAIPTALVDNDTGTFRGGTKQARVTAAAEEGATSLTVDELQFALADDESALYMGVNTKRVRGGTAVGLTNAELEGAHTDGIMWGPAADSDDVVRLLAYDVPDVDEDNDADLLRPGTLIKVNFLPGWSSLSTAVKNKIRAAYDVTVGAPGEEVAAS